MLKKSVYITFLVIALVSVWIGVHAEAFYDPYQNLMSDPEHPQKLDEAVIDSICQLSDEEAYALDEESRSNVTFDHSPIVKYTALPASFQNTQENKLTSASSLNAIFTQIHDKHRIKILMLGDSHVRGGYYPRAVESELRRLLQGCQIEFSVISKNGVTLSYFLDETRLSSIERTHPDLIIMSVGTNEAHGTFLSDSYTGKLSSFVEQVSARCAGVKVLFTTPPGSYKSTYCRKTISVPVTSRRGNGKRRRTRTTMRQTTVTVVSGKNPNQVTTQVARTISSFARQSDDCAVWDLTNICGGANGCINWHRAGLMAGDQIHYTSSAYNLQGTMLADAFVNAYNNFYN